MTLKTKKNNKSVTDFINSVTDIKARNDCITLMDLMEERTGKKASMWGDSIVGFGSYSYKYKSGHSGEWFLVGFSPRKQNLTLYLTCDLDQFVEQLEKLGKYKRGKGCLYLKNLAGANIEVLGELIDKCVELFSKD